MSSKLDHFQYFNRRRMKSELNQRIFTLLGSNQSLDAAYLDEALKRIEKLEEKVAIKE